MMSFARLQNFTQYLINSPWLLCIGSARHHLAKCSLISICSTIRDTRVILWSLYMGFLYLGSSHLHRHELSLSRDVRSAIIFFHACHFFEVSMYATHQSIRSRRIRLETKHIHLIDHSTSQALEIRYCHGELVAWIWFPHYWPFVRGIRRSSMDSVHKGHRLSLLTP